MDKEKAQQIAMRFLQSQLVDEYSDYIRNHEQDFLKPSAKYKNDFEAELHVPNGESEHDDEESNHRIRAEAAVDVPPDGEVFKPSSGIWTNRDWLEAVLLSSTEHNFPQDLEFIKKINQQYPEALLCWLPQREVHDIDYPLSVNLLMLLNEIVDLADKGKVPNKEVFDVGLNDLRALARSIVKERIPTFRQKIDKKRQWVINDVLDHLFGLDENKVALDSLQDILQQRSKFIVQTINSTDEVALIECFQQAHCCLDENGKLPKYMQEEYGEILIEAANILKPYVTTEYHPDHSSAEKNDKDIAKQEKLDNADKNVKRSFLAKLISTASRISQSLGYERKMFSGPSAGEAGGWQH